MKRIPKNFWRLQRWPRIIVVILEKEELYSQLTFYTATESGYNRENRSLGNSVYRQVWMEADMQNSIKNKVFDFKGNLRLLFHLTALGLQRA